MFRILPSLVFPPQVELAQKICKGTAIKFHLFDVFGPKKRLNTPEEAAEWSASTGQCIVEGITFHKIPSKQGAVFRIECPECKKLYTLKAFVKHALSYRKKP